MGWQKGLTIVAIGLGMSCLPGARKSSEGRQLGLASEPKPAAPKPFAVVFAGPKGDTIDAHEVSIVFNRSMVPLELGDRPAPDAVTIKSANGRPKGEWQWLGTNTLMFRGELALATEFTVEVPTRLRAMDESALAEPYTFSFTTERPSLVSVTPIDDDSTEALRPGSAFEARFSQPVELAEIERAVTVEAETGDNHQKIAVRAERVDAANTKLAKLTPKVSLPLDTSILIRADAKLVGISGGLPSGKPSVTRMRTYGRLAVRHVRCSSHNCLPGSLIFVAFTNAVVSVAAQKSVSIDGLTIPWRKSTNDDEKGRSTVLTLPLSLEAAKTYRVNVGAGIVDEFGQRLEKSAQFTIKSGHYLPALELGLAGNVIEKGGAVSDIPISMINVPSFELVTTQADDALALAMHCAEGKDWQVLSGRRPPKTIKPPIVEDKRAIHRLIFRDIFGGDRGIGAVGVSSEAGSQARLVSRTDLGVSAKISRFGGLVWVTQLSSGKPVKGARVSLATCGAGGAWQGESDERGVATIPASSLERVVGEHAWETRGLILVNAVDDATFASIEDVAQGDGAWVDRWGSLRHRGLLFTDRGVYRPGETAQVKGIIRKEVATGSEVPAGASVDVEAFDGQGNSLYEQTVTLSRFGTFALSIPVTATASLGTMRIEAKIGTKDDVQEISTYAELGAYRASEFKVGVAGDKGHYIRGDNAQFTITADYLFGAPMAAATGHVEITQSPTWFEPPHTEGLATSDDAYRSDMSEHVAAQPRIQQSFALDKRGRVTSSTQLSPPNQTGPHAVHAEAEVMDATRQSVAASSTVILHPAEFYLGVTRGAEYFVKKGAALNPSVIAVAPDGTRKAGVKVAIDVYKRSWSSAATANGEGAPHFESKPHDQRVSGCEVVTTLVDAKCVLPLQDVGYFVVRASARDPRGNPVAASESFYGVDEGGDTASGWRMRDGHGLELVADKREYKPGEVAHVLVKNPFNEADALVTVERDGIYKTERLTLRGATPTIDIPVTENMRPNAFVAVHLIRGRVKAPGKGADATGPVFRLGYARILLETTSRVLKVEVHTDKMQYKPGDTVLADILVRDASGRPATGEVTFFAVDEGVLMLTGYKLPDVASTLHAPRSLHVWSLDSREQLARTFLMHMANPGVDKGDEGGGGGNVRADFRATAHFAPSLLLGADGHVRNSFKLPDNLTAYRLMAVVTSDSDKFGTGQATITSQKALMVRPAMPRFVRAGDTFEAAVAINTKVANTEVTITLDAKGVDVTGDRTRKLRAGSDGTVEVRWPVRAASVGSAVFAFRATSDAGTDAVVVTRTIQAPLALEAVALSGETSESHQEKLGDLARARKDVGTVEVRLAPTVLVGLGAGINQLVEYEYECTEQLTSKLLPLVNFLDMSRALDVSLPPHPEALADSIIAKIVGRRGYDGGFLYWPSERARSNPWLSAYVLLTLDRAQRAGFAVPQSALDGARAYLVSYLKNERPLVSRAFVQDVFATIGHADPGALTKLFEGRDKLSIAERAYLAHAMAFAKMDLEKAGELLQIEDRVRLTSTTAIVVDNILDSYIPEMVSDVTTTADVLRAIVAVNPEHPLLSKLARGLVDTRTMSGTWRNTHEAAWALTALEDYRRVALKAAPDFDGSVSLGSSALLTAPFHGPAFGAKKVVKPLAELQNGDTLTFDVKGSGTLFYETRLRYALAAMPEKPLDRGFAIIKYMRPVSMDSLAAARSSLPRASVASARGGELVLIDLLVTATDPRRQVVIDDPLPAGLEAIDARFATASRAQASVGSDGFDDDSNSFDTAHAMGTALRTSFTHREMHDDRVLTFIADMQPGVYHYQYLARATTLGNFVLPPTRAECMYEPETFGRTAGGAFGVLP